MTDQQLQWYERYKYIIPLKIAKYAPEYVNDEDLQQELTVEMLEYIVEKSGEFEGIAPYKVCTLLHNYVVACIKRYVKADTKDHDFFLIYCIKQAESRGRADPFNAITQKNSKAYMGRVLSLITVRESLVLSLRFGLCTGETMTLKEVGTILGVSKDRVRQIENKAIKRLRNPANIRYVRDYFG